MARSELQNTLTRREWLALATLAGLALPTMSLVAAPPEVETAMALIPAGPFLMGTAPQQAEDLALKFGWHASWLSGELPQRTVELPGFRMDKYPVTNRSYAAFVIATGCQSPQHWPASQPPVEALDHPVVRVSRANASAYAQWAGKRLPTAAEWEKAARGTEGWLYPWGNQFDARACQHDPGGVAPPTGTAPVTAHPRGVSPYGVMDLVGNVAEWCSDGPGGGSAYIKGGCWLSTSPLTLRGAAVGLSGFDNNQLDYVGFRCVQTI